MTTQGGMGVARGGRGTSDSDGGATKQETEVARTMAGPAPVDADDQPQDTNQSADDAPADLAERPAGSGSGRRNRKGRAPSPRTRTAASGWQGNRMAALGTALQQLRDTLSVTRFGLALHTADQADQHSTALVAQLDDYLLPRLARLDAPLLVVVGGSTGAGKSTLVNSLLRAPVSPAGVLRPTTRSPVLVCNPDDVRWFGEAHLLPEIPRVSAVVQGPRLQLVTAPDLPPGVAFLDAPDIDSVVDANRDLAGQLLAAADLWLFLTTASRYADAVPWDVLRDAEERGAAVALVLDRVPAHGREVVAGHLRQMLVDNGFGDAPLFIVGEQPLDNQGLLPEETVGPMREWFASLASDADRRDAVVRQTLSGTLTSIKPRVEAIAVQADAQRDAAVALRVTVQNAYAEALARVEEGLSDGALLRGEVLARWQELVGSGDLTRALQARIGKLRDQVRAAMTGRPLPGRQFRAALSSGTAALISASAADAAEQAAAQWGVHPAGRVLLETAEENHRDRLRYHRASPDLEERAEKLVADWQRSVLDLVRKEAGNKRSLARLTAYTVNATGLLVMVGVFASTAFIPTGAEIAVAGGTTVASQKILEAIFGDQAVRQLAAHAKQDLLDQVRVLLDDERQRYTDLLHEAGVDSSAADRLRTAAGDVERARVAAGLAPTRSALAPAPLVPDEPEPVRMPEQHAGDTAADHDDVSPEVSDDPGPEADTSETVEDGGTGEDTGGGGTTVSAGTARGAAATGKARAARARTAKGRFAKSASDPAAAAKADAGAPDAPKVTEDSTDPDSGSNLDSGSGLDDTATPDKADSAATSPHQDTTDPATRRGNGSGEARAERKVKRPPKITRRRR